MIMIKCKKNCRSFNRTILATQEFDFLADAPAGSLGPQNVLNSTGNNDLSSFGQLGGVANTTIPRPLHMPPQRMQSPFNQVRCFLSPILPRCKMA